MNSMIMYEILQDYNKKPYYTLYDNYISINDDRFGRIVSFKLYYNNDKLMADFMEANQTFPVNVTRSITKPILSSYDFKTKWTNYYNFNN